MPAAVRDLASAAPDAVDERVSGAEDPGIEDRVAGLSRERRMTGVERQKIGARADGEGPRAARERLRPTSQSGVDEPPPGRAAGERQNVALQRAEPLGIFELAQFVRRADRNVRVGSDAKAPAGVEPGAPRENSVAEVGFGDGAEARDRPGSCEALCFAGVHMRRVDEAPARADGRMVQEPADRPRAERGEATLDLRDLLARVDVDRKLTRQRDDVGELVGRRRAQAVRRDAERRVRIVSHELFASLEQAGEAVEAGDEPALLRLRRRPAEAGVRIEDRQERQTDSRFARRGDNAPSHLGGIGVGRAVQRVVEIVEFGDGGEARLQHLDIEFGGDRLDVVGGHHQREAVHCLAPGPEGVGVAAAALGKARHRPLKGVAVQVRERRDKDRVPFVAGARGYAALDRRDRSVLDRQPDSGSPAVRGQRDVGMNGSQARLRSAAAFLRFDAICIAIIRGSGKRVAMGQPTDEVETIWLNARLATLAPEMPGLGIVDKGAVAARGGRIAFAGRQDELPSALRERAQRIVDCEGRWITPGLIDCHTHLVYGGDRAEEFEMRLAGASYEEIARAGGGILSTVRATREAGEEELTVTALRRLDALIAEGVTTLEVKSGYGLETAAERKSLAVARRLGERRPVTVRATFLAAHAIPPEFAGRREAYLEFVLGETLPALAREGLVDAVDAFCERIAFSLPEVARVFDAARRLGLPVKLHADQLSDGGGAALAAEFHALSADHLEYADEAGVEAMARAGVVAALLPGAFYTLRERQAPPVALLRKHRVAIAVATDSNPGTSPMTSMLLALNMAATLFGLTVEECVKGATRNAAKALGLGAETGTLEAGKWADLAIWEVERPAELVYHLGFNPLHARVWRGR